MTPFAVNTAAAEIARAFKWAGQPPEIAPELN